MTTIPVFDQQAHPRGGDGKFTAKTLTDSGTEVDLGTWSVPSAAHFGQTDEQIMTDPAWIGQQGVPLHIASRWARMGFEPGQAAAFIAAEVADPGRAAQWRHLTGSDGHDIQAWTSHGFDAESASRWLDAGNPPPPVEQEIPEPSLPASSWAECEHIAPEQGYAWDAADFTPAQADSYAAHGLGITEASDWRGVGVGGESVPTWTSAGFTATTAAQWLNEGHLTPSTI